MPRGSVERLEPQVVEDEQLHAERPLDAGEATVATGEGERRTASECARREIAIGFVAECRGEPGLPTRSTTRHTAQEHPFEAVIQYSHRRRASERRDGAPRL